MNNAVHSKLFGNIQIAAPAVIGVLAAVAVKLTCVCWTAPILLLLFGAALSGYVYFLLKHYLPQILREALEKSGGEALEVKEKVNRAMNEVLEMEDEFSDSFEKISTGGEYLLQLTGQVAAVIGELDQAVADVARNTEDVARYASNADREVATGKLKVGETVGEIKKLAGAVQASSTRIHDLGKRSEEIGSIISVIEDIADQTNLLALNAAIEAARAGDMGRGFAVVADEVRRLAERTTAATKQIAGVIKSIQNEIKSVIESMGTIENGMAESQHTADKAGESLEEISGAIATVTERINLIAAASTEQSQAIEGISANMQSVLAETRNVAITSEMSSQFSVDFLDRLKAVRYIAK